MSGKSARKKRKEAMDTQEELQAPLTPEDLKSEKGHIASVIRQLGAQLNSALTPQDQKLPVMLARSQLISTYALIELHEVLVVAGGLDPEPTGLVS